MGGENHDYLRWVKSLRCSAPAAPIECWGVTEAHHAGARCMGRKAHDETAIPLCTGHHRAWHANRGPFCGWPRYRRYVWGDLRIAETQAKWAARATSLPDWF